MQKMEAKNLVANNVTYDTIINIWAKAGMAAEAETWLRARAG